MARPLRLEFPGAVYHLTSRGNARQKVFFTDADRELFLSTLAGVVRRYQWICHAYCLMANHTHLLIETPKANLSIGMRQLNGSTLRASTGDTGGSAICFKAGSRRSWWRRKRISWSSTATWCSIRCARARPGVRSCSNTS